MSMYMVSVSLSVLTFTHKFGTSSLICYDLCPPDKTPRPQFLRNLRINREFRMSQLQGRSDDLEF